MAGLAAAPERRAVFRETKRLGALSTELQSSGHLRVRRGYLEKATDWPTPERLEMDGDRLIITAGNEPPRVVDVSMAPELRTLIDAVRGPLVGDTAALRRGFTATTAGTLASWTLHLVPRDPAGARLLRSVTMQGQADQVAQLTIIQANGDEDVMLITPQ
ncbi:MAG: LolA-related protein [Janthinobacterium lividum]